jgi:hypothetical protein
MAAVFKSVSDRRAPDGCCLDVQSGLRARKVDCRCLDNLDAGLRSLWLFTPDCEGKKPA